MAPSRSVADGWKHWIRVAAVGAFDAGRSMEQILEEVQRQIEERDGEGPVRTAILPATYQFVGFCRQNLHSHEDCPNCGGTRKVVMRYTNDGIGSVYEAPAPVDAEPGIIIGTEDPG